MEATEHSTLDIKEKEEILETMKYISSKIQNAREFEYKYEILERMSAETGLKLSKIALFLKGKEYPTVEEFILFEPFFDSIDFSIYERIIKILYEKNIFNKEKTLIGKILFELDEIRKRLSKLEERTDISNITQSHNITKKYIGSNFMDKNIQEAKE